jgi:hypothetical protein
MEFFFAKHLKTKPSPTLKIIVSGLGTHRKDPKLPKLGRMLLVKLAV